MEIYDFRKKKSRFEITTSKQEIHDLFLAWIAITFAFTIATVGISFSAAFLMVFLLSSLTVGIGFIAHELGHKIVAQKYGCFAEFRAFPQMLILGLISAFFGFVFAAPGAVMIGGYVTKKNSGKIAAAGPLMNLMIASIFLTLLFVFPIGILSYGFKINAWLALFNMIPLWAFDGLKILTWNKKVYLAIAAVSLIFFFL